LLLHPLQPQNQLVRISGSNFRNVPIHIGNNVSDSQIVLGQQGGKPGHHPCFPSGPQATVTQKKSKRQPDQNTDQKPGVLPQLTASFTITKTTLHTNVYLREKVVGK